jgi:hypothetical protein
LPLRDLADHRTQTFQAVITWLALNGDYRTIIFLLQGSWLWLWVIDRWWLGRLWRRWHLRLRDSA